MFYTRFECSFVFTLVSNVVLLLLVEKAPERKRSAKNDKKRKEKEEDLTIEKNWAVSSLLVSGVSSSLVSSVAFIFTRFECSFDLHSFRV